MVSKKSVSVVSSVRYFALAVLCAIPLFAGNSHGQERATETLPPAQEEAKKGEPRSDNAQHGLGVQFFPPGALYAPYIADPRRVDFGLQVLHYSAVTIPDSGNTRFDLKTGGRFDFVLIHPGGDADLGWQIGLEGGFNAQFDIDKHLDNIGWDGRYGLLITTAQTKNLSLKFGYLHDSSHVGDEYVLRTGRQRIGYTREELVAGISWLSGSWRTYGEYGHAQLMGNRQLQKPGRVQFGLEWQQAQPLQGLYRGWYAAADLSAMEERDWKRDLSVQAGYRIDSIGKTWRIGADWYSGRPPIGEFFQYTERYLGFGLWIDI